MGIEPTHESWELEPRAADTGHQFHDLRNEALKESREAIRSGGGKILRELEPF